MNLIESVLSKLDTPKPAPVEKTASESIDSVIESALASLGGEKTASDGAKEASPVATLMKVASEVAAADEDANIKLAHRMGAAFVDGQVERMRQYEKAAAEVEAEGSEKDAAFQAGFDETVELIHKTAAAHFAIGHDAIVAVIEGR